MRRMISQVPPVDVALAIVLLVVKLVTLAAGIQPGGGAISYGSALFVTLPLAWRSRCPVTVAVVVSLAQVTEVAVGGYHDSVVSLAAWIIVAYSLGAHTARPRQLAAGITVTTTTGLWVASQQPSSPMWNVVASAAFLLSGVLAGLWVRQLRMRSLMLTRLAKQLEKERDHQAEVAVADERARIARELHDEIAHAMSVIAVQADAAEGALASDPLLVRQPLVAIRDTARSALVDMRRVLGMLRDDAPAPLDSGPHLARLPTLIGQVRQAGLEVTVQILGKPVTLSPAVEAAAFRVIQEGLTNVRKHAGASRTDVLLRYGGDTLEVEIRDDGSGGGEGGGSGRGIVGIRERVALLGGSLTAGRQPQGFLLSVSLPVS